MELDEISHNPSGKDALQSSRSNLFLAIDFKGDFLIIFALFCCAYVSFLSF